jgi:hypothetical protein
VKPSADHIGDTLRVFYAVYGTPDEGPPPNVNVTELLPDSGIAAEDLALLRTAIDDQTLRRQFGICRAILEDLANRLTSEELLRELSAIPACKRDFEELSSGVFWFSLASSLDRRENGAPTTPFDKQIHLPLPVKIRMTVQGSLVLRLYLSLVYMREGVMADLIAQGAEAGKTCCGRVRKLLNCDYVRRIRNALSHGSFSSSAAGITFRDDNGVILATPGFLNWLCTWLMLIQLQALSACSRAYDA